LPIRETHKIRSVTRQVLDVVRKIIRFVVVAIEETDRKSINTHRAYIGKTKNTQLVD